MMAWSWRPSGTCARNTLVIRKVSPASGKRATAPWPPLLIRAPTLSPLATMATLSGQGPARARRIAIDEAVSSSSSAQATRERPGVTWDQAEGRVREGERARRPGMTQGNPVTARTKIFPSHSHAWRILVASAIRRSGQPATSGGRRVKRR